MAERKSVLIRIDPSLHDALQRWAAAELRSLNGQIEYALKRALEQAGRLPPDPAAGSRSTRKEA